VIGTGPGLTTTGSPGSLIIEIDDITQQLKITNTTQSTSPTTGAFTVSGGVGIGGNLFQLSGSDIVMEVGPEAYTSAYAASIASELNSTTG
jgi:hypothetical protein